MVWNRKNLGQGSKAVGGAASVGDNVQLGLVLVLVDTNNEHGGILTRGGDNNLLGTTLVQASKPSQFLIHKQDERLKKT